MVFFICNSCGSCLKKAKVDAHVYQCRGASFSCMDCNKDFRGNDYKDHTKCITEEEKYASIHDKSASKPKKGEEKQQNWLNIIQGALDREGTKLNVDSRNLIETILKHQNIPRKKPKFLNFIKNITKNYFGEMTIEKVWTFMESAWKTEIESKKPKAPEVSQDKNDDDDVTVEKVEEETQEKKSKKKKKNKKDKIDLESEPLQQETEILENGDAEQDNLISSSKKRKKDKKKAKEITEEEQQQVVEEEINVEPEPIIHKKKKNKRKKKEDDEEQLLENDDEAVEEEEPKKKKRKKDKDIIAEEEVPQVAEEEPEEETKKKKKKHKKDKEKNGIINGN